MASRTPDTNRQVLSPTSVANRRQGNNNFSLLSKAKNERSAGGGPLRLMPFVNRRVSSKKEQLRAAAAAAALEQQQQQFLNQNIPPPIETVSFDADGHHQHTDGNLTDTTAVSSLTDRDGLNAMANEARKQQQKTMAEQRVTRAATASAGDSSTDISIFGPPQLRQQPPSPPPPPPPSLRIPTPQQQQKHLVEVTRNNIIPRDRSASSPKITRPLSHDPDDAATRSLQPQPQVRNFAVPPPSPLPQSSTGQKYDPAEQTPSNNSIARRRQLHDPSDSRRASHDPADTAIVKAFRQSRDPSEAIENAPFSPKRGIREPSPRHDIGSSKSPPSPSLLATASDRAYAYEARRTTVGIHRPPTPKAKPIPSPGIERAKQLDDEDGAIGGPPPPPTPPRNKRPPTPTSASQTVSASNKLLLAGAEQTNKRVVSTASKRMTFDQVKALLSRPGGSGSEPPVLGEMTRRLTAEPPSSLYPSQPKQHGTPTNNIRDPFPFEQRVSSMSSSGAREPSPNGPVNRRKSAGYRPPTPRIGGGGEGGSPRNNNNNRPVTNIKSLEPRSDPPSSPPAVARTAVDAPEDNRFDECSSAAPEHEVVEHDEEFGFNNDDDGDQVLNQEEAADNEEEEEEGDAEKQASSSGKGTKVTEDVATSEGDAEKQASSSNKDQDETKGAKELATSEGDAEKQASSCDEDETKGAKDLATNEGDAEKQASSSNKDETKGAKDPATNEGDAEKQASSSNEDETNALVSTESPGSPADTDFTDSVPFDLGMAQKKEEIVNLHATETKQLEPEVVDLTEDENFEEIVGNISRQIRQQLDQVIDLEGVEQVDQFIDLEGVTSEDLVTPSSAQLKEIQPALANALAGISDVTADNDQDSTCRQDKDDKSKTGMRRTRASRYKELTSSGGSLVRDRLLRHATFSKAKPRVPATDLSTSRNDDSVGSPNHPASVTSRKRKDEVSNKSSSQNTGGKKATQPSGEQPLASRRDELCSVSSAEEAKPAASKVEPPNLKAASKATSSKPINQATSNRLLTSPKGSNTDSSADKDAVDKKAMMEALESILPSKKPNIRIRKQKRRRKTLPPRANTDDVRAAVTKKASAAAKKHKSKELTPEEAKAIARTALMSSTTKRVNKSSQPPEVISVAENDTVSDLDYSVKHFPLYTVNVNGADAVSELEIPRLDYSHSSISVTPSIKSPFDRYATLDPSPNEKDSANPNTSGSFKEEQEPEPEKVSDKDSDVRVAAVKKMIGDLQNNTALGDEITEWETGDSGPEGIEMVFKERPLSADWDMRSDDKSRDEQTLAAVPPKQAAFCGSGFLQVLALDEPAANESSNQARSPPPPTSNSTKMPTKNVSRVVSPAPAVRETQGEQDACIERKAILEVLALDEPPALKQLEIDNHAEPTPPGKISRVAVTQLPARKEEIPSPSESPTNSIGSSAAVVKSDELSKKHHPGKPRLTIVRSLVSHGTAGGSGANGDGMEEIVDGGYEDFAAGSRGFNKPFARGSADGKKPFSAKKWAPDTVSDDQSFGNDQSRAFNKTFSSTIEKKPFSFSSKQKASDAAQLDELSLGNAQTSSQWTDIAEEIIEAELGREIYAPGHPPEEEVGSLKNDTAGVISDCDSKKSSSRHDEKHNENASQNKQEENASQKSSGKDDNHKENTSQKTTENHATTDQASDYEDEDAIEKKSTVSSVAGSVASKVKILTDYGEATLLLTPLSKASLKAKAGNKNTSQNGNDPEPTSEGETEVIDLTAIGSFEDFGIDEAVWLFDVSPRANSVDRDLWQPKSADLDSVMDLAAARSAESDRYETDDLNLAAQAPQPPSETVKKLPESSESERSPLFVPSLRASQIPAGFLSHPARYSIPENEVVEPAIVVVQGEDVGPVLVTVAKVADPISYRQSEYRQPEYVNLVEPEHFGFPSSTRQPAENYRMEQNQNALLFPSNLAVSRGDIDVHEAQSSSEQYGAGKPMSSPAEKRSSQLPPYPEATEAEARLRKRLFSKQSRVRPAPEQLSNSFYFQRDFDIDQTPILSFDSAVGKRGFFGPAESMGEEPLDNQRHRGYLSSNSSSITKSSTKESSNHGDDISGSIYSPGIASTYVSHLSELDGQRQNDGSYTSKYAEADLRLSKSIDLTDGETDKSDYRDVNDESQGLKQDQAGLIQSFDSDEGRSLQLISRVARESEQAVSEDQSADKSVVGKPTISADNNSPGASDIAKKPSDGNSEGRYLHTYNIVPESEQAVSDDKSVDSSDIDKPSDSKDIKNPEALEVATELLKADAKIAIDGEISIESSMSMDKSTSATSADKKPHAKPRVDDHSALEREALVSKIEKVEDRSISATSANKKPHGKPPVGDHSALEREALVSKTEKVEDRSTSATSANKKPHAKPRMGDHSALEREASVSKIEKVEDRSTSAASANKKPHAKPRMGDHPALEREALASKTENVKETAETKRRDDASLALLDQPKPPAEINIGPWEVASDYQSPRSSQLGKPVSKTFMDIFFAGAHQFVCGAQMSTKDLTSPKPILANELSSDVKRNSRTTESRELEVQDKDELDLVCEGTESVVCGHENEEGDNSKNMRPGENPASRPPPQEGEKKRQKEFSSGVKRNIRTTENQELEKDELDLVCEGTESIVCGEEIEQGDDSKNLRPGEKPGSRPPPRQEGIGKQLTEETLAAKDALDVYGETLEAHFCANGQIHQVASQKDMIDYYGETIESHFCAAVTEIAPPSSATIVANTANNHKLYEKRRAREMALFVDSSSDEQNPKRTSKETELIQAETVSNTQNLEYDTPTRQSLKETEPRQAAIAEFPHNQENDTEEPGEHIILVKKTSVDGTSGRETPDTLASGDPSTAENTENRVHSQRNDEKVSNIEELLQHPTFEAALEKYLVGKGYSRPSAIAMIAAAPHLIRTRVGLTPPGIGRPRKDPPTVRELADLANRGLDPPSADPTSEDESYPEPSVVKDESDISTYQSNAKEDGPGLDQSNAKEEEIQKGTGPGAETAEGDTAENKILKPKNEDESTLRPLFASVSDEPDDAESPIPDGPKWFDETHEGVEIMVKEDGEEVKGAPEEAIEEGATQLDGAPLEATEEVEAPLDAGAEGTIQEVITGPGSSVASRQNKNSQEATGPNSTERIVHSLIDWSDGSSALEAGDDDKARVDKQDVDIDGSAQDAKDSAAKTGGAVGDHGMAESKGNEMILALEHSIESLCSYSIQEFFSDEAKPERKKIYITGTNYPDSAYPEIVLVRTGETQGESDKDLRVPTEDDPTLEARASELSPTNANDSLSDNIRELESYRGPIPIDHDENGRGHQIMGTAGTAVTRSFRNMTGGSSGGAGSLVVSDFDDSAVGVDPVLGPLTSFSSSQFLRSNAPQSDFDDGDSDLHMVLTRSDTDSHVAMDSNSSFSERGKHVTMDPGSSFSEKGKPQQFARAERVRSLLETSRNRQPATATRPSTRSVASTENMATSVNGQDGQNGLSRSPRLQSVLERMKRRQDPQRRSGPIMDAGPVDPDDLFHRYNAMVQGMNVSDPSRLRRIHTRQQSDKAREEVLYSTRFASHQRSLLDREIGLSESTTRSQEIQAVGRSGSDSEYSTTPSEKARELRRQLDQALKTSVAIRGTQERLTAEISTFKTKLQSQREAARQGVEAIAARISPVGSPRNAASAPAGSSQDASGVTAGSTRNTLVVPGSANPTRPQGSAAAGSSGNALVVPGATNRTRPRGRSPGRKTETHSSPITDSISSKEDSAPVPRLLASVDSSDTENSGRWSGGETSGSETDDYSIRLQQLDSIIHGLKDAQRRQKDFYVNNNR